MGAERRCFEFGSKNKVSQTILIKMICGGAGKAEVTDDVRAIVKEMQKDIEKQTQAKGRNGMITDLEVTEVMTQVVAGVNYFVKCKVNKQDEFIMARIYDKFGDKSLSSVKVGVGADEAVAYFDYPQECFDDD